MLYRQHIGYRWRKEKIWEMMSSSALCDTRAWGTGGYFWNIILKSREGLSGFVSSVSSDLWCQSCYNFKLQNEVLYGEEENKETVPFFAAAVYLWQSVLSPLSPCYCNYCLPRTYWCEAYYVGLVRQISAGMLCPPYLSPRRRRKWVPLSRGTVVFLTVRDGAQIHGIIDII